METGYTYVFGLIEIKGDDKVFSTYSTDVTFLFC